MDTNIDALHVFSDVLVVDLYEGIFYGKSHRRSCIRLYEWPYVSLEFFRF